MLRAGLDRDPPQLGEFRDARLAAETGADEREIEREANGYSQSERDQTVQRKTLCEMNWRM
jgi:hypothetical protein